MEDRIRRADESAMNLLGWPRSNRLFTEVPRRSVLRTSPVRYSRKFAFKILHRPLDRPQAS